MTPTSPFQFKTRAEVAAKATEIIQFLSTDPHAPAGGTLLVRAPDALLVLLTAAVYVYCKAGNDIPGNHPFRDVMKDIEAFVAAGMAWIKE